MDDFFANSENVEHTEEYLKNSVPISYAKTFIDYMKNAHADVDTKDKLTFCIIDVFAGIGTQTITFLKCESVGMLLAFTQKEKINMLKNNIFQLSDKKLLQYCSVESSYFNFPNLEKYKGCSAFVNLDDTDKPLEMIKNIFETYKNIFNYIGFYTKNVSILPITGKNGFVLGKTYDRLNIFYQEDEKLYDEYIKNEFGLLNISDEITMDEYVPSKINTSKTDVSKTDVSKTKEQKTEVSKTKEQKTEIDIKKETVFKTVDNKPPSMVKWSEFCKKLPSAPKDWSSVDSGKKSNLKLFQEYVFIVLTHICPEKLASQMITEEYMPIWVQSITHESYDLVSNYEQTETYGDSVLGYSMIQYLLQRFPNITSAGLTEYKNRYMAKEFQKDFSYQMKLPTWLLSEEVDTSIHINEDLFESFVGAILTVANSIVYGLGVNLSLNFIILVLSDTKFDSAMILGKSITRLQQRGAMLLKSEEELDEDDEDEDGKKVKGGIHSVQIDNPDGSITIRIKINNVLSDYLKTNLHKIFTDPLVEVTKQTAKDARNHAWDKAAELLEDGGYTNEFTQKQLILHMFDGIDQDLVKRCKEKALQQGYNNLRLKKPKGTGKKGTVVYTLLGVDNSEVPKKLSISKGDNALDAKENAMRKYLL